jgi:hypothetical protein
MDQLDKLEFETIPVEYFEESLFGDKLLCSIVDILREGDC